MNRFSYLKSVLKTPDEYSHAVHTWTIVSDKDSQLATIALQVYMKYCVIFAGCLYREERHKEEWKQ